MIIRARAPLRLGLAGGGSDVSPYCDQYGGFILNATIDRYAYAVIKPIDEPVARFIAADQQVECEIKSGEELQLDGELDLHKAVYRYMIKHYNDNKPISLELSTFCDAPAGSGLGSSSTIVVAMVSAFVELLNIPVDDYQIAQIAFRLERLDCGLQGGRQDQYAATFGGFNFMEFYEGEQAIINPLRIKKWVICELEASLVLFYTGTSRDSAQIIADQSKSVNSGRDNTLNAMHGIKQEALVMKEAILKADFSGIVTSMREGWENKKKSSKTVSNPLIDEVYNSAIDAGALAGKVSGAGGGGFMLFFAPTENRMDVIRTLARYDGYVSNCHFTEHGVQVWKAS